MHERRQVLIYPGEDGFWVVECPSLPGCISQGKTKEEALENIEEAIELFVQSLRADGMPVPEDQFHAEESWTDEERRALDKKINDASEQLVVGKVYGPEEARQKLTAMRASHLANQG